MQLDLFFGEKQPRFGRASRGDGLLRRQADGLLDAFLPAFNASDGIFWRPLRNALLHKLGHAQGQFAHT